MLRMYVCDMVLRFYIIYIYILVLIVYFQALLHVSCIFRSVSENCTAIRIDVIEIPFISKLIHNARQIIY